MKQYLPQTGGENKSNPWPHPVNEQFNDVIRNAVLIFGLGREEDAEIMKECKAYLHSRIEGILKHRIRRQTEEYFRTLNLRIEHPFHKTESEVNKIIEDCSFVLCVGEWDQDKRCLNLFKMARILNKPIYDMQHNPEIPIDQTVRYLEPVRPITDTVWKPELQEDILVYRDPIDDVYEIIDGNHRHEFANRVGGVQTLSGWVMTPI